ncbi:MAG TPA: DUF5985 family protein [Acidobacteriaceae bacterium]|nr:DUF5985 family protein [Acidobacteriaceae bacterium]
MLIDGFALGFVATTSLVAAMFFLRFWVRTRDFLFMAFAIAFAFQAVASAYMVVVGNPNRVRSWIYAVYLATYLLLLFAILRKNRRARR